MPLLNSRENTTFSMHGFCRTHCVQAQILISKNLLQFLWQLQKSIQIKRLWKVPMIFSQNNVESCGKMPNKVQ